MTRSPRTPNNRTRFCSIAPSTTSSTAAYEIARITLNTLINTYDQSEFLAKAKLAVADSWFREGGAAGLAQAEAEYKDFILFYPTMDEAAESQQKICQIHYKQMDKVDRDQTQAIRAEDECRQLIVQFPNSKYVDETKQLLRNIQEAIAEGEYLVGEFYFKRGDNSAAANRLSHVVEQYPLYSKADLALWQMGEAYGQLGSRFRKQEGEAYARIVRDYPLSDYADDATSKLKELELPVPEADKAAVARMQYEKDHTEKARLCFTQHPVPPPRSGYEHGRAIRAIPAMTTLRPSVPPLVPQPAGAGGAGFSGEVTATPVGNSNALDTKPDARDESAAAQPPPPAAAASPAAATPAADAPQQTTSKRRPTKTARRKRRARSSSTGARRPLIQPAAAQPAAAAPAAPLIRIEPHPPGGRQPARAAHGRANSARGGLRSCQPHRWQRRACCAWPTSIPT